MVDVFKWRTRIVSVTVASVLCVGVPVTAMAATVPQSAGPATEPLPADVGVPVAVAAADAATVTLSVTGTGTFTGTVTDSVSAPVAGASVTVTATRVGGGQPPVTTTTTTNGSGAFSGTLGLPSGTWTVSAECGVATSTPASLAVSPSLTVSASVPVSVSETTSTLQVSVRDHGVLVPGRIDAIRREADGVDIQVGSAVAVNGQATFAVQSWRNPTYVVKATYEGASAAVSVVGATTPRFPVTTLPASAPVPAQAHPLTAPPSGAGAAGVVQRIPNSVWSAMVGVSWQRGCVARAKLRLIEINYVGFDGYRHRGQIVVNKAVGGKTKNIFTRLYDARFPLRHMRLVDAYGKNTGRPGANDYKSMAADNTSGFNCRFVVGKESAGVRSPHASGRSLDINPWENPYVARNGVYPNRYFLNRSIRTRATFFRGSKALKVLRSAGCSWGGSYRDYHHFDC